MPRTARAVEAGTIYHVCNRGNGRLRLFHKRGDYDAFVRILAEACKRHDAALMAYCLMPNHWHLVLLPHSATALARFVGWLCVTHVRRHHEHYHTTGGGHLYQGRYKSFPTQDDSHLLTVLRYVEANACRAKLVRRAEEWRYGSLWARAQADAAVPLGEWPLDRPRDWTAIVNEAISENSLEQVRRCVKRGRPYGSEEWVRKTAKRLGLEFTLRERGRPRKNRSKQ